MTLLDFLAADSADHNTYKTALARFQRLMSVILLMLGLVYWAIIIGVMPAGTGPFTAMALHDKIATSHFAVADLVAAVGLWMRAPWANVIWIYAALSAVAAHAAFPDMFGYNPLLVAFHIIALVIFGVLEVQVRRSTP